MRIGLCSVTFRELDAERIIALAVDAGLDAIEWGGDVHVPAGDISAAQHVAKLTTQAGLVSCSYGSYFRAGEGEEFAPVLDAASALGVERIRVWAGRLGSAGADDRSRAAITDRLREAATEAAERGIELGLEFHGGTLADTPAATARLLREVGHPALGTYWQPTVAADSATAVAEYRALAADVSAVHVFSWWPTTERRPLAHRSDLWEGFFAEAAAQPNPPIDALLEFVPDDDPEALVAEARALRSFRDGAWATLGSRA